MPDLSSLAEKKFDWLKVSDGVAWEPRDSMGHLFFKDQFWVFGGWIGTHVSCPRDVWSSPDGIHWKLVCQEAPWKHSDLPGCVVFKDRMWVMSGWYNARLPGHEPGNEVWSSADGANWVKAKNNAAWEPRMGVGIVTFKDRIWVMGGVLHSFGGNDSDLRNDVWSSADGENWELMGASAGWQPRAYHQVIVFNGKMWVMGGGNYLPNYQTFRDVWCSEDGVKWQEVTSEVPWPGRLWFSLVVYRDRMWVFGGWSNFPFVDWNDVWHSADGKTWIPLESDVVWAKRHAQAAYVFGDKIWVIGGHARPLTNDLWTLELPAE